jgi:hypothetical protein
MPLVIGRLAIRRLRHRPLAVERFELSQIHLLDIAADAALGKAERHPWLEMMDDLRRHIGMFI